jgi:Type I phosphodiesterase / nucleotide pyrophosphatase
MVSVVAKLIVQGAVVVGLGTFVRLPSAMVNVPQQAALDTSVEVAPAPPAPVPESPRTEAVVLVVLDGARWQEVLVATDNRFAMGADRGVTADLLMPNLHQMIAEGAAIGAPDHGYPMVASGPNFISLPGYNEIFSGRTPFSCADNECAPAREPTIVDELRTSASDVAVFSSWGPIARAAALHSSEVVMSTGIPGTGEFRADRATADRALAYLAEQRPSFLFLGLGEPDEYAHRFDYPGYLNSLRQADAVLGEIRQELVEMGERGQRTTVFVTCDHGRSDNFRDHGAPWPESSRVWLVAFGGAIPARGFVTTERRHRLADIAPTVRKLLGLPGDLASGAGSPIAELLP